MWEYDSWHEGKMEHWLVLGFENCAVEQADYMGFVNWIISNESQLRTMVIYGRKTVDDDWTKEKRFFEGINYRSENCTVCNQTVKCLGRVCEYLYIYLSVWNMEQGVSTKIE